jgi:hypothetical protein
MPFQTEPATRALRWADSMAQVSGARLCRAHSLVVASRPGAPRERFAPERAPRA